MDDVEREIQMQIFALHNHVRRGNVVKRETSSKLEMIKQCPNCKTWIERYQNDCNQMFCTICKTVWIWDTLEIVNNVLDVHNPLFFNKQTTFEINNDVVINNRGVMKCLKALHEENVRYMSDTYIYRVLFTTEQINFDEFKTMIRDRYNTFIKHIKLKQILETDCDNIKIKQLNTKWNLTNDNVYLPYV
jgi:hypothetical protein